MGVVMGQLQLKPEVADQSSQLAYPIHIVGIAFKEA